MRLEVNYGLYCRFHSIFIQVSLTLSNTLIGSIFTAYNDIETGILVNGELTEFFKPQRGLRQGDPLSGLLFIIIATTGSPIQVTIGILAT